jgi:hypothetical protein
MRLPPPPPPPRGGFGRGVAQPGRRAAARGGAQGGGTPPPQRILRSYWAGEGLWACQKGQIGQKMVRFGQLGAARSRQGASIEVHEAGRIRPSSGGNGGHVVSLYPLVWRSLRWPPNGTRPHRIGSGAAAHRQPAERQPGCSKLHCTKPIVDSDLRSL